MSRSEIQKGHTLVDENITPNLLRPAKHLVFKYIQPIKTQGRIASTPKRCAGPASQLHLRRTGRTLALQINGKKSLRITG